jgi:hypothetical protein
MLLRAYSEPWYWSFLTQYGVIALVVVIIVILLFSGSNRQRDPRAGSKE